MGLDRYHCTSTVYWAVLAASLVTSAVVRHLPEDLIGGDRKWPIVGVSGSHVTTGVGRAVKVESGYLTQGGGHTLGNARQRAVKVAYDVKTQGENKDGVLAPLPRWRDEKASDAHGQLAEQHIRARRRAVRPSSQAVVCVHSYCLKLRFQIYGMQHANATEIGKACKNTVVLPYV